MCHSCKTNPFTCIDRWSKQNFILALYACAMVNQGRKAILHRLIPFPHAKRRALEGGHEQLCPPPQAQPGPFQKISPSTSALQEWPPIAGAIARNGSPPAEGTSIMLSWSSSTWLGRLDTPSFVEGLPIWQIAGHGAPRQGGGQICHLTG